MARQIFVNLPVRDLKASRAFFTKLGFTFNEHFCDDKALCMIVAENSSYVMLLERSFFQTFTERAPCDTASHTEALLAFSCESRESVDAMVKAAVDAGGRQARDPLDHGFMYGWSFYDLDGHHWEPLWMDPQAIQPA